MCATRTSAAQLAITYCFEFVFREVEAAENALRGESPDCISARPVFLPPKVPSWHVSDGRGI